MIPFELPPERIRDLVARHGTPIYVVSRGRIVENYRRLDRALPAVTLFYAVKANPHEGILRTLAGIGAGFDVASQGEIEAALAAGADARSSPTRSRIPGTSPTPRGSAWTTSPSTTPRRSPRSPATPPAPTCTCGSASRTRAAWRT
jgi:2-polyprenyl-6-methoxyphenol hydroxylase-like FAD-dependent oxidoreductase